MRRFLVLTAVLLACAAPAQAAPRPLIESAENEGFALAGDVVLFTETTGRTLRVRSMPAGGGPARTIHTVTAPAGLQPYGEQFSANAQRASMLVVFFDKTGAGKVTQIVGGPPSGGWTAVTPRLEIGGGAPVPVVMHLSGDRVFTVETRVALSEDHVVAVYEPQRRELADLPVGTTFAGDLVATRVPPPASAPEPLSRQLKVADSRTGATITTADFKEPIGDIALRPDGRVALNVDGAIYDVRPGAAPVRLGEGITPAFAGERVVTFAGDRLQVFDPAPRPFGIPTRSLERFVADERHVLWRANDCLLIAAVTDAPAGAVGPGPCRRAEVEIDASLRPRLGRRIGIRLNCVTGTCSGTLRLTQRGRLMSVPHRYRIAAGRSATVSVRLKPGALARLRRDTAVTVETGDGRVLELSLRV